MNFVIPGLTRNPVKWARNARHWIPAFAGMTLIIFAGRVNNGCN
jgi:hypothetical protein